MTRKVNWFKWEQVAGEAKYGKVPKGTAIFHQFGVDYEEFESGPGNFSTAIIELDDGTVKNVPVRNIAFIDEEAK